ncbi:predicted protein [Postia placenta Mad-698-R]|nr:predicted protein [Postia placenta Mad-698-R]
MPVRDNRVRGLRPPATRTPELSSSFLTARTLVIPIWGGESITNESKSLWLQEGAGSYNGFEQECRFFEYTSQDLWCVQDGLSLMKVDYGTARELPSWSIHARSSHHVGLGRATSFDTIRRCLPNMSRPDLYRSGNTTSPKLDNVRKGMDIKSVSLGTGLTGKNDHGTHWLIALTSAMIFDEYVSLLRALISKCKKAGTRAAKEGAAEAFTAHIPLPAANSASKTIHVVFNALSTVYRDMPEIAGWDENDYAYVGVLACALDSGEFSLESTAWSGEGVKSTKAQRFIAQVVAVHMQMEKQRLVSVEDESDEVVNMNNDHAVLTSVLKLDNPQNPLTVFV